MKIKAFYTLWNNYYSEFEKISKYTDVSVEELIRMDLTDKNFNGDEIQFLMFGNTGFLIEYKFIAYVLLHYDDFTNIDDLIKIVKEQGLYDELKDDLMNILAQRNDIDY